MADSINELNGIASTVPGEQEIRGGDTVATNDFTLSPVITVTKKEASFTKGDLKLQKVSVTEDISESESMAEDTESTNSLEESPAVSNATDIETGEEVKKVSKIPRLRFRAAVNRIRSEQRSEEHIRSIEAAGSSTRRSSIPRLRTNKTPPSKEVEKKRESINFDDLITDVTEADFDKIYEEVVEKTIVPDESKDKIENRDPSVVDAKFDNIIHAYDTNKIEPLKIEKPRSKIPMLKRKSEHEIDVKSYQRELQRKSSLGRIPLSNSFGEKISVLPKTKTTHDSNGTKTLLSTEDVEATLSDNTANNDSINIANSNEVHTAVTVTKIPLSQNKYTKISSTVLNKQPIRVNTIDNCIFKQNDSQTSGNEENREQENLEESISIDDVELQTPEAESESEINRLSAISPPLADLSEPEVSNDSNNNVNENIISVNSDQNYVVPIDNVEKNINESSNHDVTDTNIVDSNIPAVISKTDELSTKPDHDYESESNKNKLYSKDYLVNETLNPPKINESEVVIKYKPDIKEVEMTKETHFINADKVTNNSKDTNKEYKPVKYKTITTSQSVEATNEEDIIVLKGKVNRVISRLDSIEPKTIKKSLDDLPKQSVKSKISLFESNEPIPTNIKKVPSKSNLLLARNDQPRVIDVVLKDTNEVDSDKRKPLEIFTNSENNVGNDRVKIAFGLKDELAYWKKNNDPHYSSTHGLRGNNKDKYVPSKTKDNVEVNGKVTATEDDAFLKQSAEIINNYKLNQQRKNINLDSDMKRAKSLAELDLVDAVTGKVKTMIHRMKSVDKIEHRKEIINSRERPRKGSVSERIALFEVRQRIS